MDRRTFIASAIATPILSIPRIVEAKPLNPIDKLFAESHSAARHLAPLFLKQHQTIGVLYHTGDLDIVRDIVFRAEQMSWDLPYRDGYTLRELTERAGIPAHTSLRRNDRHRVTWDNRNDAIFGLIPKNGSMHSHQGRTLNATLRYKLNDNADTRFKIDLYPCVACSYNWKEFDVVV